MAGDVQGEEVRVEPLHQNRGAICREILRELPYWFGIPEAIEEYAAFADGAPMLVAVRNGIIGGFVVLRDTSDAACEMHVIAVRPALHRLGLGRSLVAAAEAATNETGRRYLTVKTIGPRRRDAAYEKTRRFYVAMGFVAIEEFADLWDGNPCLLMLKALPPPCHPELVEGQLTT